MVDIGHIREQFQNHYTLHPRLIVRAPGRVNLLGEHTDYNEGYVLPVAIDRATYVAVRPSDAQHIQVFAADLDDEDLFALDQIERSIAHPWSNYIRGVVKSLLAAGHALSGAQLLIRSDVPRGAGLSSSASLTVATGYAFQVLNRLNILGEELALLAQGAENSFVGVQCGIMDQFISALGQADHALLLDCRTLSYQPIPLPTEVKIVVCNSHIVHVLADSAYNQRRTECQSAVQLLKQWYPTITALRDVTPEQLQRHAAELPAPLPARVRHVVRENDRVLRGAAALERGDVATFGMLMDASHASLRDDYQVSISEIDLLVDAAQRVPGCYGARLMGGGFGGSTVNLVAEAAIARFQRDVAASYREQTGRETTIAVFRASDGVGRAVSLT
jgi:galactokinase